VGAAEMVAPDEVGDPDKADQAVVVREGTLERVVAEDITTSSRHREAVAREVEAERSTALQEL
tara:strand:- start:428 stop:616 length:189 start_codon:yes stop_codon:yes gene_type:complete